MNQPRSRCNRQPASRPTATLRYYTLLNPTSTQKIVPHVHVHVHVHAHDMYMCMYMCTIHGVEQQKLGPGLEVTPAPRPRTPCAAQSRA